MATEAFPAGPDQGPMYPAAGQQRVLAALQQDVAAGEHLLCVTGPAGSGKTVLLRALQQSLGPGLVTLIENPTPGRVLVDVARVLHLDLSDDDDTILRRQLVVMLSTIEKQHAPIIQIVDDADRLTTDDLNLLMHFFPAGHATLVLAGVNAPQACRNDDTIDSGAPPRIHAYRIEPFSTDETAGYIRHRLRAAALAEDLIPSATVAAIHQNSGGLPGAINRYCADAIAQGKAQTNTEPAPAKPVIAPSIKKQAEILWPTLDEDIVADILTAPVRERGYGNKTVPSPELTTSEPTDTSHEYGAVAQQVRRLRRRARRWRTVGVLASIALVAVLTKDAWIDRLPWDNPLLAGLRDQFATASTAEDSATEADRSTASGNAGELPRAATSDTTEQSAALLPPRSPSATTTPSPSSQTLNAPSPAPAPAPTPTPTPTPLASGPPAAVPNNNASPARAAPGTMEEITPSQPLPSTAHSAASAPPVSAAPEQKHAKHERAVSRSARTASHIASQTRAERRAIGRLYMQRAEYEWSQGDLGAAAISIEHGLAADPRNPVLLRMRAQLPDVLRDR